MGIAPTMRLLLTEDDVELAQSLIERFRDQGYEVVHVGDGLEGLHEATRQDFDAIIVDRGAAKKICASNIADLP